MTTRESGESVPENSGSGPKVLCVLEALADQGRVTGIARVTNLPKSTVHRMLQLLVDQEFAVFDGDGGYRVSPRTLGLAGRVLRNLDPVDRLAPVLLELQRTTGCTTHFAMLFNDALVYVDKVEADRPYRMASRVGMRLDWHCTAIGKAVLSAMSQPRRDETLALLELSARTSRTVSSTAALTRHLTAARTNGFALDDEENENGVRCVAAAVHDHSGTVIGAISLSTLALEHDLGHLEEFGTDVVRAAGQASAALGYTE